MEVETKIEIEPIGIVRSCYSEKFGIPRQPGLVESAIAEIELLPLWNREELVKGLEEFSHIWVHFLFHAAVKEGWKDTVRPPGLGGKKRVGVFASRSPHRPNHMGMSVVKLVGVEMHKSGIILMVTGGDFLDGTPVLDIKPYASYSDSVVDATSSYAGKFTDVRVEPDIAVSEFCSRYQQETGRDLRSLIQEVLEQDPRPSSQKKKRKEFGVLLWDVNVRFRVVQGGGRPDLFEVYACDKAGKAD